MTNTTHRIALTLVLTAIALTACPAQSATPPQSHRIHCVTDISHEFTFYFDGRFGKNYVSPNGVDARNWGTLHKYDFTNVNLLILQSSASPCPYTPEDIDRIGDGAVTLLGLAKKLSDPVAIDFLEKIAGLPAKVDLAGAKPVGPFGMLGALSSKEARQGLGVLMELTKAMGSLKNGGSSVAAQQSKPIA